ncbi:uncharacterized protein LOC135934728 [Cloeon dipterum]|uniref:uncharacterized protein LOC135934728 n=1 Tax=Cloeon dipterum TaxID=197152 RepID=UPI00321FB974
MVFCDSPEAVEYLLENGSDPNAVDAKGFSVVMHAISCQKPSAEVLDMLIRAGASLKLPEPSKDVFSFALTRFPPPLEQSSRMPEIVPALEFLFSMANKARSVQLPDFYKDIFASLMEYNWTTIDVFVSTCISVMMSPFFNPAKLYALPIEKVPEQDSLASYLHLCGISIMGLLDKDYFFVNALGYFLNTYFKNNPTQNTNLSILLQDVNKTLLLVEEEGIVVPPALLMLYLYFQKKITQRDELSINIYDLLNYFTLLKVQWTSRFFAKCAN